MDMINKKNKLLFHISAALILIISAFSIYTLISGALTLGQQEEGWDGVSIATSFSGGNGSLENPYLITSEEEFIYFKSLIEGDNFLDYQNKYYVLEKDLDFSSHDITSIGTETSETKRIFMGNFDGKGHSISNINNLGREINNTLYYGLFSKTNAATISNLSINGITIVPQSTTTEIIIGGLVGEANTSSKEISSNFSNIIINDFNIDGSNIEQANSITIGGFIGQTSAFVNFNNIYLKGNINKVKETNKTGLVSGNIKGTSNNILIDISSDIETFYGNSQKTINHYKVLNNKYYLDNEEVTLSDILNKFNENSPKYSWEFTDRLILKEKYLNNNISESSKSFNFSLQKSADILLHDSGIVGDTIYINDLDMDYNYYMGLNYSEARDTKTIPTGTDRSIYTDSNLIRVHTLYDGSDVNNKDLIGHVSLEEQVQKFIYYKYYKINDGYIEFELIDNPYGDRPNDKYFQGWITDYPGAIISYDSDLYVRKVKVPVIPGEKNISITFHAVWGEGKNYLLTSNDMKDEAFNYLDSNGMELVGEEKFIYEPSLDEIYYQGSLNRNETYPNNSYDTYGNPLTGRCNNYWGCPHYTLVKNEETFNQHAEFYQLINQRMTRVEVSKISQRFESSISAGANISGYFRAKTLNRGESVTGLYDQLGNILNGTCNSNNCNYYELIQYYDNNGVPNLYDGKEKIYRLVTRDTNVIILDTTISGAYNPSKPATLTSIHNGKDYAGAYNLSGILKPNADFRIEHITMTSTTTNYRDQSQISRANRYIAGNCYNLKIGRGIKKSGNSFNAQAVIGAGNTTVSSHKNYRTIIETGYYNFGAVGNSSSGSINVHGEMIWGSDFDRILNPKNGPEITFATSGSWYGRVDTDNRDLAFTTIVKSGKFGTSEYDYSTGIYVGARNNGTQNTAHQIIVEGGWIYNIVGGPLTNQSRQNLNATYIFMKGGEVNQIVGGAGRSTTYGHRVISVTGGTVNYSVFGGSNGIQSSNNEGQIVGSSFIYIGGNAIIGNDQLIANGKKQDGAESGSVFGIGNGKNNQNNIGAMNSSYIIIDRNTTIKNNVYGGGNYGRVGLSEKTSSTLNIYGGTINGSVYGGGNNNGSGANNISSTININMNGGTILGSVYGGSKETGVVYGNTQVNVTNGIIYNDVYGGGEGEDTYIKDSVKVSIGNEKSNNLIINGNVYGGSAYGTVNGLRNSINYYSTTDVVVKNGVIKKAVYGGAKGSSQYTPHVYGNISVYIYGGSIGQVFGGFDASGEPNAKDNVYLLGGVVGEAFAGGNNTGQQKGLIYLDGGTVSDLYGGSNKQGNVETTYVHILKGQVNNIYGGNNIAGRTNKSYMEIVGSLINGDIYGGGNRAPSGDTFVYVKDIKINDLYGGGREAGINQSNIRLINTTGKNIFGGSNISGDAAKSVIVNDGGVIESIYGGNNAGGETSSANIYINSGEITNLYGGGDKTKSGASTINILGGNLTNVYGGGNGGTSPDGTTLAAGVDNSKVLISGGDVTNLYGGSNQSGDLLTSTIDIDKAWAVDIKVSGVDSGEFPEDVEFSGNADIKLNILNTTERRESSWFQTHYYTDAEMEVVVDNNSTWDLASWDASFNVPNLESVSGQGVVIKGTGVSITSNELIPTGDSYTLKFNITSECRESEFEVGAIKLSNERFVKPGNDSNNGTIAWNATYHEVTTGNISVSNIYGGNNAGGYTASTNVSIMRGKVSTVYGGGNEANVGKTYVKVNGGEFNDIYGGGNAAGVLENTLLDINGGQINGNIYGGGNEGTVDGSTKVFITDARILKNAYAGGNGNTAIVSKNSEITIDGNSVIGYEGAKVPNAGCVFGSGNAAATGLSDTEDAKATSTSTVNIIGANIYGNVYGGPKMSTVYGHSYTNIGNRAVNNSDLKEADIKIKGTVFGGGESNPEGGDAYDWTHISVTEGIDVNINGSGYLNNNHKFIINGSIFGSGNASSSAGDSNVNIKNLGTKETPNKSISIQRVTELVIDNSVIELEGTFDRTNDYADIKYSFNRIDKMIIKNNTRLLLQKNANLLQELYSGVDIDGKLTPASVSINDADKSISKNVDNRIYMIPNQNLNVTINQAATAYGKVTGMTFFGMYNSYSNGTYRYGVYDDSINYGDPGNAGLAIVGGSYVLGLHSANHDITKDGFYSNFLDDEYTEVTTAYIDPTPIGDTGYRWIIGLTAVNYNFTLNASKYSSLGTHELQLIDFAEGDTTFTVLGFNSEGLSEGVNLVDSKDVPRIGKTKEEANSILGLSMKAETQEWTGYGTTKMMSENKGKITGDKQYITDSRKLPPSLMFYLYHAKNITLEGDLGTVVVMLEAAVPINEIDYKIQLITITIDIVAKVYDDADSYDASITYDKRYEIPSSTSVNITNKSQFTAYYSLITWNDKFEGVYGKNNEYYHVLTTNNPLPVGTMITMMDFGANEKRPNYYYFKITDEIYQDSLTQLEQFNEITYRLDNFIKMGSTSSNNTYSDKVANKLYYSEEYKLADEEFIFIFDFKECLTTGNHLDNTILFELRNSEERAIYTVLGIRQGLMKYSTYDSSNIKISQEIKNVDEYLYYDIADEIDYKTQINYDQTDNRESVIDTNYESSSMGLNISLFDKSFKQVSSSLLTGTSIKIDNKEYFADSDGVFRIKLASKVSNLNKKINIITNKDLPTGLYTFRYTLFASSDGLHNSNIENSVSEDFKVNVVSAENSISVSSELEKAIVDGETALNLTGNKENKYKVKYNSELINPNIRVEIFKRNIDTIDTVQFTSIPFNLLFTSTEIISNTPNSNEIILNMGTLKEKEFKFNLVDNLTSGTYRIVFRLYDNNQIIDNDVEYVIIKKNSE